MKWEPDAHGSYLFDLLCLERLSMLAYCYRILMNGATEFHYF